MNSRNYFSKFILFACIFMQLSSGLFAQKVFVVEKIGRAKHFIYKTDHRIRLQAGEPPVIISGNLTGISDTALVIDHFTPVKISNILRVEKPRSFWLHSTPKWFVASIAYAVGSMINHWINPAPANDNTILPVSGSLAGIGIISYQMSYRKIPVGDKWKVKVLDFDHPALP